jgi:hypothetical protein
MLTALSYKGDALDDIGYIDCLGLEQRGYTAGVNAKNGLNVNVVVLVLFRLRVFAVMADSVHQRFVGHHKKYRGVFRRILVAVKIPKRDHKRVALFPFVALIADGADAAAAPYVINRRACMTMALGFFSAAEHLDLAGHRWQCRPPRQWIGVIQHDSVMGIAGLLTQFAQSALGIRPFIAEGRWLD